MIIASKTIYPTLERYLIKMNEVVKILMRRDGITEQEALEAIRDCREQINYFCARGDFIAAEDCIMDELGLEPDYLWDIIV